MTKYDSKVDTLAHIARVNALGKDFMTILTWQIKKHDASKLEGIEKKTFDEIRPLLKEFAYGSPEYTLTSRIAPSTIA